MSGEEEGSLQEINSGQEDTAVNSEMNSLQIKLKNVFWICSLLIVFHILLIFTFSQLQTSDSSTSQNIGFIEETNYKNNLVLNKVKVKKRQISTMNDKHILKRREPVDNSNVEKQKKNLNAKIKNDVAELCVKGHSPDISANCEAGGCLRKLQSTKTSTESGPNYKTDILIREIKRTRGKIHRIHLDIVPFLTSLQWRNGVYGSVAVLGDNVGLMTRLVTANTNITCGETVILIPSSSADYVHNNNEVFKQNIHLCPGYHNFTKNYFVQKDIPQFRFISIDINDNYGLLTHLIEMTSCILREGGILVVDNTQSDEITRHVRNYYNRHGTSAMMPLLATGNKLYFASPRWKMLFTNELLENQTLLSSFIQSYDNKFNSDSFYLSTVGSWV